MRKFSFLLLSLLLMACNTKEENTKTKTAPATISADDQNQVIEELKKKYPEAQTLRIERGVKQTAGLWHSEQGDKKVFTDFCLSNFVPDSVSYDRLFGKLQRNFEILWGNNSVIQMRLNEPLDLPNGEVEKVDLMFGAFNPSAHLESDLYDNKVAFLTTLNFPQYSLEEKNTMGKNWSRQQWAYARMGEVFTSRIPSELNISMSQVSSDADMYISTYNIPMGEIYNDNNKFMFPKGMNLLTHWNLRDEIKANYSDKENGLEKQQMVYQVMKRIIDQTIPSEVINSETYQWNPFSNELKKEGKTIESKPEGGKRYEQMYRIFAEKKKQDALYPEAMNTYIKRKFDGEMEISQPKVEDLFIRFVSSPQAKKVGEIIASRLGRPLQPFDIWYDGFKSRSSMDQNMLNTKTRSLYPNALALEKNIPTLLTQLGYDKGRAQYLGEKIVVDPARGSGHARGAAMKGDKAHLRTRIAPEGMDYKGYNIAIHELGHNVEQTISLYDVDNYMLNGVPNTSFTEALAFMFQKRDLDLLGISNPENTDLATLDTFWSLYEIMGVSLVDMRTWQWMYDHPDASVADIQQAVQDISMQVWNEYYAPVFGVKDQPILGIYSHMISYPLYLSAYSFGRLIFFQLENHVKDLPKAKFASEIDRVFKLGRLTPDAWMEQAVGQTISIEPTLNAVEQIKHQN
ncbi:MAG: hypothetical protein ACRC9Q_00385 [Bacteroidales bacterium]